jgi:hypothetical protein
MLPKRKKAHSRDSTTDNPNTDWEMPITTMLKEREEWKKQQKTIKMNSIDHSDHTFWGQHFKKTDKKRIWYKKDVFYNQNKKYTIS